MAFFRQIVCAVCVTVVIIKTTMISAQESQQLQLSKSTTTTPTPVVPIRIGFKQSQGSASSTAKPFAFKFPQPDDIKEIVSSYVNAEKKENKSRVGVHVPLVFDMTKDSDSDRSKLDLSVLSGLVTVNKDKSRQDGVVEDGPVVSVFGIPVYRGRKVKSPGRLVPDNTLIVRGEGSQYQFLKPSDSIRVRKEPFSPTMDVAREPEATLDDITDMFSRALSQLHKLREKLTSDRFLELL